MKKLILHRDNTMTGLAEKMECYMNDELICSLARGEQQVFEIDMENDCFIFKCRLGPVNPSLKPIKIDMSNCYSVQIDMVQGAWRPKVEIHKSMMDLSQEFSPTQTIGTLFGINERTRQWAILQGSYGTLKNAIPHRYDEIISFDLLENGSSIVTTGGMGRAIAGGLLFGSAGAIVGGVTGKRKSDSICSSLKIKITLSNIDTPVEYIELINSETPKKGRKYQTAYTNAQEILSLLEIIHKGGTNENQKAESSLSISDELKKAKQLLDEEIITEDEFQQLKKKILDY